MTVDPSVIALAASGAGFRGHGSNTDGSNPGNLDIAVAVALAESGGDPGAKNTKQNADHTGCVAWGLWQILQCPSWPQTGTIRAQVAADPTDNDLNAKAAYQISSGGTNFHPWSTYTSGAYKSHLAQAWTGVQTALANPGAVPSGAGAGGQTLNGKVGTDPLTDAENDLETAGGTAGQLASLVKELYVFSNPKAWYRVGLYVLGLGAIIAGLLILSRDTLASGAKDAAIAAVAA